MHEEKLQKALEILKENKTVKYACWGDDGLQVTFKVDGEKYVQQFIGSDEEIFEQLETIK